MVKRVADVTSDIAMAPRSPAGCGHTPWIPAVPSPQREGGHPAAALAPQQHHHHVPAGLLGTAAMQETEQEPPGQLPVLMMQWHRGRGAAGVGSGVGNGTGAGWPHGRGLGAVMAAAAQCW